jgi:hypothetical protein
MLAQNHVGLPAIAAKGALAQEDARDEAALDLCQHRA